MEVGDDRVFIREDTDSRLLSGVGSVVSRIEGVAGGFSKTFSTEIVVCTAEEAYTTAGFTALYLPTVCVELSR